MQQSMRSPTHALLTLSAPIDPTLGGSTWSAPDVRPLDVQPSVPPRPPRVASSSSTRNTGRLTLPSRVSSAGATTSCRSGSAGALRKRSPASTLQLVEQYLISPRGTTPEALDHQRAVARHEQCNLPPCRPSPRVLRSAQHARPSTASGSAAYRPPSGSLATYPTFCAAYPEASGLQVSAFPDNALGKKRQEDHRAAEAMVELAMQQLASFPGGAGIVRRPMSGGSSIATNDGACTFDTIWITREQHLAFVRETMRAMAEEFYQTTLPAVYRDAVVAVGAPNARMRHGKISPAPPTRKHVPRTVGAPRLDADLATAAHGHRNRLRSGVEVDGRQSTASPSLDSTSSDEHQPEFDDVKSDDAPSVAVSMEPADVVASKSVPYAPPHGATSSTPILPALSFLHTISSTGGPPSASAAASIVATERKCQVENLKKEVQRLKDAVAAQREAAKKREEGPAELAFTSDEVFAKNANFEPGLHESTIRQDTEAPTSKERLSTLLLPPADLKLAALQSGSVRNSKCGDELEPTKASLEKLVRFRQQATFALRRKLRALIEKKRPGGRFLALLQVDADREMLSLNHAVGPRKASVTPSSQTPAPLVSPNNTSLQPGTATVLSLGAATVPTSNSNATPATVGVHPVLDGLESFEVPPSLLESKEAVGTLLVEYNEVLQAVRKSQQRIHGLSKGTMEEKRKILLELGIRLPDAPSPAASPQAPRRMGSSVFRNRRFSTVGRGGARGKGKRSAQRNGANAGDGAGGFSFASTTAFSDCCLQTTLNDELMVYVFHRVEALAAHEKAYRSMWSTMFVALRNIVRMWDDVEVDLSCARCKSMLVDAMIVAPCGITVCRDCVRDDDDQAFASYERSDCGCLNHDGAIPNVWMRRFCKAFAARDVTGAITPVPSEALLGELDYQLKVVGVALELIKTENKMVSVKDAANQRKAKDLNNVGRVSSDELPGSILMASKVPTPFKAGAGKRSQRANERRRRSVVIKATDDVSGEDSDTDVVLKPAAHPQLDATLAAQPLFAMMKNVGLGDCMVELQDHYMQMYKRRIANYFHTQFRISGLR